MNAAGLREGMTGWRTGTAGFARGCSRAAHAGSLGEDDEVRAARQPGEGGVAAGRGRSGNRAWVVGRPGEGERGAAHRRA